MLFNYYKTKYLLKKALYENNNLQHLVYELDEEMAKKNTEIQELIDKCQSYKNKLYTIYSQLDIKKKETDALKAGLNSVINVEEGIAK